VPASLREPLSSGEREALAARSTKLAAPPSTGTLTRDVGCGVELTDVGSGNARCVAGCGTCCDRRSKRRRRG
jgi:hypothetical protein